MKEAATVSNNFLVNCQKKTSKAMEEEDPFVEDEHQKYAAVGYVYKIWNLSKDVNLCIRSTIDSYNEMSGETMNLFTLPQWNTKRQVWSTGLDTMTPVCFTKEISDNSCKFSRWTVRSILGGVDKMRFAFVARTDAEGKGHKLVGNHVVATNAFVKQLNLSLSNCWGCLKDIIETVHLHEDTEGRYVYMKDPQ